MTRTHEIKLGKEYCDSVLYGDKKFEVRYNDRGYQTGDSIKFKPVDRFGEINHPIADKLYRITYIHSGMGLEKDWVVFAIEDIGFEPPKVREELCRSY